MKSSFLLFCVVVLLGFVAGFYYHEASDEKIQYERDTCYEVMNRHLAITNPYYYNDLDINNTRGLYAKD